MATLDIDSNNIMIIIIIIFMIILIMIRMINTKFIVLKKIRKVKNYNKTKQEGFFVW